jgi:hypothetical protein
LTIYLFVVVKIRRKSETLYYFVWQLKEQEIRSITWIAECIAQNARGRIHDYVSIISLVKFDKPFFGYLFQQLIKCLLFFSLLE